MKLMQMKYYRTNEFEKKSEITLVISNPCGKKKPPKSDTQLAACQNIVETTK